MISLLVELTRLRLIREWIEHCLYIHSYKKYINTRPRVRYSDPHCKRIKASYVCIFWHVDIKQQKIIETKKFQNYFLTWKSRNCITKWHWPDVDSLYEKELKVQTNSKAVTAWYPLGKYFLKGSRVQIPVREFFLNRGELFMMNLGEDPFYCLPSSGIWWGSLSPLLPTNYLIILISCHFTEKFRCKREYP